MWRRTGQPFLTRSEAIAPAAMASSSQPVATTTALAVMRAGGSAIDAAIAANAVLGLTEPTGCGIGGDLFALVGTADGGIHGYNGSGRAARGGTLEAVAKASGEAIPPLSIHAVTVPGAVRGWHDLHSRWGRLAWSELFTAAIHYARDGFPVTREIASAWEVGARQRADQPGFAEVFLPGGRAPAMGETFRNPRLATTLEHIAAAGADAFYAGDMAARAVTDLQAWGSFLTLEDLAAHTGEWVEPLSLPFAGHTVWGLPPNGQGAITLLQLGILDGLWDATRRWDDPANLHLFAEAAKLAYRDRAQALGDSAPLPPDFLAPERLAQLRDAIAPRRAHDGLSTTALPSSHDTVYLATADAEGLMVSLIQSNYMGLGTGLCPGGLGFSLQNRGCGFRLEAGHPNQYAPGRRPFHTIIPGMLSRDGQPWLAFGVMGGDYQPQGQAWITLLHLLHGLDLQEAGDAPRLFQQPAVLPERPGQTPWPALELEPGFATTAVRDLLQRGHRVVWAPGPLGGYQAVGRLPDRAGWRGATESRKDGIAAGY